MLFGIFNPKFRPSNESIYFHIHNKKRSHLPLSTHSSNGVQTENVLENTA